MRQDTCRLRSYGVTASVIDWVPTGVDASTTVPNVFAPRSVHRGRGHDGFPSTISIPIGTPPAHKTCNRNQILGLRSLSSLLKGLDEHWRTPWLLVEWNCTAPYRLGAISGSRSRTTFLPSVYSCGTIFHCIVAAGHPPTGRTVAQESHSEEKQPKNNAHVGGGGDIAPWMPGRQLGAWFCTRPSVTVESIFWTKMVSQKMAWAVVLCGTESICERAWKGSR